MADTFLSEIRLFAFGFAPKNWAVCDGSLLQINQNTGLFSLLGTTYGGNGETTFALPDLRARAAAGFGQGPGLADRSLGESSGSPTAVVTAAMLPAHTHPLARPTALTSTTKNPVGMVAGPTAGASYGPVSASTGAGYTSGSAGTGQPLPIRSPYLGLTYCICVVGDFPAFD